MPPIIHPFHKKTSLKGNFKSLPLTPDVVEGNSMLDMTNLAGNQLWPHCLIDNFDDAFNSLSIWVVPLVKHYEQKLNTKSGQTDNFVIPSPKARRESLKGGARMGRRKDKSIAAITQKVSLAISY